MAGVRIYRVKWDHAAMGTPNEYVVFYLSYPLYGAGRHAK